MRYRLLFAYKERDDMKEYVVKFEFIVKAKDKEQARQRAIDDPSAYFQSEEIEEV